MFQFISLILNHKTVIHAWQRARHVSINFNEQSQWQMRYVKVSGFKICKGTRIKSITFMTYMATNMVSISIKVIISIKVLVTPPRIKSHIIWKQFKDKILNQNILWNNSLIQRCRKSLSKCSSLSIDKFTKQKPRGGKWLCFCLNKFTKNH